jgi:hypothetical protein
VRRASITVEPRIIAVKGYVRDVLRDAGMKPIPVAKRGFLLDRHRMADAVAALENAGYAVTVVEAVIE